MSTIMTKSKGFTLIELMIAVGIVGILMVIAIPAYQDSVRNSRRSDAKIALTNLAALQERRYSLQNAYTTTLNLIGGNVSPEGYYAIAVNQNACTDDGTCYLATATAQGSQADDTECGNFTLSHTGARGISGTGSAADCW